MQAMMAAPNPSFRPGAPMPGASRGTPAPPFHADPRLLMLLHHLVAGGHIPSFAYGGVAYKPTLAMVGDNGPEAMVPLGGQPQQMGGAAGRFGVSGQAVNNLRPMLDTINGGSKHTINDLLSGGTGGNAAFGPDYLRNALRSRALVNYGSQRRGADVLSHLYGLDPMQARGAAVNAEVGASGDLSGALNSAEFQGMSGYQDLLQRLLMGERGYQQQDIGDLRAAEEAKKARGNPFANAAGFVAGKGIDYLTAGRGGKK